MDKLAAFVGFNEATLQADMQIAMSEIKIRFASEVGAYG